MQPVSWRVSSGHQTTGPAAPCVRSQPRDWQSSAGDYLVSSGLSLSSLLNRAAATSRSTLSSSSPKKAVPRRHDACGGVVHRVCKSQTSGGGALIVLWCHRLTQDASRPLGPRFLYSAVLSRLAGGP